VEAAQREDRGTEYGCLLDSENMGQHHEIHRIPLDLIIQDDGIIAPSDTRDVLGLGLELAADERASRQGSGPGGRGEIGADGDAGGWGVFRM